MRGLVLAILIIQASSAFASRVRVPDKEIRAKALQSVGAIQGCYKAYQQREPHRFGKIYFDFRILPSGEVSAVQLRETDLGDAPFFDCVLSNVATWRFRPASGPTQVNAFYFSLQP